MNTRLRVKLVLAGSAVLLLLVGVVVFAGILGKAKPIPPEKIVTAERGDIARSVVARGKIEPLSKVEVKSKANGIIKALLVDVGDRGHGRPGPGRTGQGGPARRRCARPRRRATARRRTCRRPSRRKPRRKIEAANPELEFTRRDYDRAQELFKQKIASQQQLDDASRAFEMSKNRQQLLDATVQTAGAQVEQARARVAAAKAALDRAEETLGYATIRAPIAGIVLTRDTELGDAVSSILNLGSAATLIMTLGDVSSVYIKGEVDEADIGKADCGQHVRTKVEAYPTESFEGVVKRIAPDGQGTEQRHHLRGARHHLQPAGQAAREHDRQRGDRPGGAQECAAHPGSRAGV